MNIYPFFLLVAPPHQNKNAAVIQRKMELQMPRDPLQGMGIRSVQERL
ncbi:MAG TPA: hypothetical protein PLO92_09330 [Anaerolineaceae bacterium]|jgi:hypothetical protein|nr:hypothetical protein [Anaerolineaceae bacterium]